MAKLEIARRVLDEEPTPEECLRLVDVAAEKLKARFRIEKRQEVIEIRSSDRAPCEVLGDEERLNALDEFLQPDEMIAIELLGAAERQRDAMDADGVVAPQLQEAVARRGLGHVVLGVDLEEADGGPGGRDRCRVWRAQADADARDCSLPRHDRRLRPVQSL